MTDRDLDITKFSFFSYRKLKKTLGEFDSVIECNEIAILEFVDKLKKSKPNQLKELSEKHSIKVDEIDVKLFENRIRQYYIISVFQQFEQFLMEFNSEWKSYHPDKEWNTKQDGQDLITYTVNETNRFFQFHYDPEIIESIEFYRLVRNYMAHNNRDIDTINRKFKKVQNHKFEYLDEMNLDSRPNDLFNINFDDFLILTNLIKHIAFKLSTASKPDNERIAEIILSLMKDDKYDTNKSIKKVLNNPKRLDNVLVNVLQSNFGRFSSQDTTEIIKYLKGLLA